MRISTLQLLITIYGNNHEESFHAHHIDVTYSHTISAFHYILLVGLLNFLSFYPGYIQRSVQFCAFNFVAICLTVQLC